MPVAWAVLTWTAMGALTACHSYEREPLVLDQTRAAWLARSASDPSVREFAATLDRSEPGRSDHFDPLDGLTLIEAEAVALVFNPDLRLARLEIGVTRATAEHAGLWQDPVLGVDLERIVSGAGGSNPWVLGSTLGITIPISGRLEAERARAGAHLAESLDRLAAREWATRAAVRELWVEWSAARIRAGLTSELVSRLVEIAALAERQERAGSMSRIDARLFRVELAGREADLIPANGRVRELELQLRGMLGLAPECDQVMIPGIAFAPRSTDPDFARQSLEQHNAELTAIRAAYEVAEQSLRTEVRKQYPDLTIGPGYGTDQGDDRVLLGLSLPIPLWNRNQQGVAQASAEREVARGRFESTYQHLATNLAVAFIRLDSARTQRAIIESSVIPLADEQEADVLRVAALGRIDPLLLLDSLKTQYTAKLRLVEARAAESLAAIRLDELIGPPITRIPDEQPPTGTGSKPTPSASDRRGTRP